MSVADTRGSVVVPLLPELLRVEVRGTRGSGSGQHRQRDKGGQDGLHGFSPVIRFRLLDQSFTLHSMGQRYVARDRDMARFADAKRLPRGCVINSDQLG